jgi:glycerol kinase
MNTGSACVPSSKLLTTIALSTSDGEVSYGLEGSVFVAGAAFRWLTDKLGILPSEDDVEAMARSVNSTEGVIFVPALTGLGSPHWDPRARGLLIGMTRATHSAHIIRAALEAVAYQTRDVIDAMRSEGTWSMEELRVGGGAANNDLLCQFQSDILGLPVVRPESVETTSLGAAFAAGLSIGLWNDIEQVRSLVRSGKRFQPSISEASRAQSLSKWERALGRSRDWLAEEVEEE